MLVKMILWLFAGFAMVVGLMTVLPSIHRDYPQAFPVVVGILLILAIFAIGGRAARREKSR